MFFKNNAIAAARPTPNNTNLSISLNKISESTKRYGKSLLQYVPSDLYVSTTSISI